MAAALHQLAAYLIPTHHSILCDLRALRNTNKEVDQGTGLTHTFWYAASSAKVFLTSKN